MIPPIPSEVWDLGSGCIFWPRQAILVDRKGNSSRLTPSRLDFLSFLTQHSGQTISYATLARDFYNTTDLRATSNKCHVAVNRLQKHFEGLHCEFLDKLSFQAGIGCSCPSARQIEIDELLQYPQIMKVCLLLSKASPHTTLTKEQIRDKVLELTQPEGRHHSFKKDPTRESRWQKTFGRTVSEANVLIRKGLVKRYGPHSEIDNLLDTISPNKPEYRSYESTYVFRDRRNDSDHYDLQWILSFVTVPHLYVIAYIDESSWADVVAGAAPAISDYFVPSRPDKSAIKPPRMSCSMRSESGLTCTQELRFEEIDRMDYGSYLGEIKEADYRHVITLLKCELPSGSGEIKCTRESQHVLRFDDYNNYWIADRPILVESLTFDIENFGKKNNFIIRFQPSFGAHTNSAVQRIKNKFVVPIHNWVVKGQGAFLWWIPNR